MKRLCTLRAQLVVAIILMLSATLLLGQKTGSQTVGQKYDLTTETKVKGTVDELKIIPGPAEGVHLMVKSGTDLLFVHVAPESFLKEMEINIQKGDPVEIVGSKIKVEGQEEILAREIIDAGNDITLRDKKGIPVWSVWDPGKK